MGDQTPNSMPAAKRQSSEDAPTVAVMEFLYHWDFFLSMVAVLEQKHKVCLIMNEAYRRHLYKYYNFDVTPYDNLVVKSISWPQIERFITAKSIQKIFMPTIQGFEFTYRMSMFNPPVPFYFTIHNFDLWTGRRSFVPGKVPPLIGEMNNVHSQCCKEIIRKSSGIIAIDESVQEFSEPLFGGKKVRCMPWKVNRNQKTIPMEKDRTEECIVFTVPASIDEQRRNYGVVLETFHQIAPRFPNIKLILLGRPVGEYGKKIIEHARSINVRVGRSMIETFSDFIHTDVYEKHLATTDYFILPLANPQVIGRYKASAAMYDAMLSGRPVLVPEQMFFGQSFKQSYGDGFIVYEDLLETITDLITAPKDSLIHIATAAVDNANRFTIEHQAEIVEQHFFKEASC